MYHSLIISGKNTYEEWEMVPTSRPLVNPPEVKTNYTEIPGSDSSLDYTDTLTGHIAYGMRTGSWEFLLIPENAWANVYSSLLNYLHGKKHTVILEDDPGYYYVGRLSIDEWNSEPHNSLVVINYQLEPYKYSVQNNGDDWLWDTSFEDTIVYSSFNVIDTAEKAVINPYNRNVSPVIICSEAMRLYCGTVNNGITTGQYYDLVIGENKNNNIILKPGSNKMVFYRTGTGLFENPNTQPALVTIKFREISL